MGVKNYTTQDQKDVVQSVQIPPVSADVLDDFEYGGVPIARSIAEITDPTHIKVNPTPATQTKPLMFDMKEQMLSDARKIQEGQEDYKREQEQTELKKTNQMFANSEPAEQEAIVSVILSANPDVVFTALKKYHSIIDTGMADANLVETNRSEFHVKKYDELLGELKADKEHLEEHLIKFAKFIHF